MKQMVRRAVARAVANLPRGILIDQNHFDIFERAGVHITPAHFYSPIPLLNEIDPSYWDKTSAMVGVDQNIPAQVRLFEEIRTAGYVDEFFALPETSNRPEQYDRSSGFRELDAAMLYGIVRHIKSRTIIEIGSGQSTLLSHEALSKNGSENRLVAIEPYPQAFLRNVAGLELVEKRVETIDLSFFECLEANDILFIDSSHTVRIGGDVVFEILEILPRLKPGVWVHIHDVFLPRHYPKSFVDRHSFWAEQYLVQAFLCFNTAYEIRWSAGIMEIAFERELAKLFTPRSSSLWLRRK